MDDRVVIMSAVPIGEQLPAGRFTRQQYEDNSLPSRTAVPHIKQPS